MLRFLTAYPRGPLVLAGVFLALLTVAASCDQAFASRATLLSPGARWWWHRVTDLGLSGYMFALSAAIGLTALVLRGATADRHRRRRLRLVAERAAYFFASIGISGLAVQALKHLVGRARPRLMPDYGAFHFEPLSMPNLLASFPSGHTTTAFSAALALGFVVPRARPALLAAAVLIGISRIAVGEHYPSDVVAGAALGSMIAVLLARVFAGRSIAFDGTSPVLRITPLDPALSATQAIGPYGR